MCKLLSESKQINQNQLQAVRVSGHQTWLPMFPKSFHIHMPPIPIPHISSRANSNELQLVFARQQSTYMLVRLAHLPASVQVKPTQGIVLGVQGLDGADWSNDWLR